MNSLILASASPRRRKLVELLPYSFTFESANCDESVSNFTSAEDFALQLARRKAVFIANKHPNTTVIGCDTIVVLENEILGKPTSKEQAVEFLVRLSAKQHQVITAYHLSLFDTSNEEIRFLSHAERTIVEFGDLTLDAINEYVNAGSPMDKAGAYGIQDDKGALFVKRIIGDYYNVVGLPLFSLNNSLTHWFNKDA